MDTSTPIVNASTLRPAVDVFHAAHGCGGLHWAQIMARDVKRKIMVMPSNNSSAIVHYWAGKYEGRIGWLVGPSAMKKTKLRPWVPFALDNDAFASWTTGRPWDEAAWLAMLGNVRAQGLSPKWVLVPDVVADRDATLAKWAKYASVAACYGWPLAIAVQDGMTPADIPANAQVIFIGGTTEWKWRSLPMWARTGARVHVGRVNEVERLHICERWRVESVDGTGWMQGTENGRQAKALGQWLEGKALPPRELGLAA
jgi:hypothetical protein